MIVRRIGHADAVERHLSTKTFDYGTPCGIYHLTATLPVVDDEVAVSVLANQVDSAGDVQGNIVNGPLLTIGTDVIIIDKAQEVLALRLDIDFLCLAFVAEQVSGLKPSCLEIVLRLFVHEGAHLTGHTTSTVPLAERLFCRNTITLLLAQGNALSVEGLEEITHKATDGQQLDFATIEINVTFGQEVDVLILFIEACIGECLHLLAHG